MKAYGIAIAEGANITNLVVASGTSFPSLPDNGELFYRSDAGTTVRGLYLYVGGAWERMSSADTITAPSGTILPATANAGDLFYKNSNDAAEGLYAYNDTAWVAVSGASTSFTVTGDVSGTLDGGTDVLTLATVNANVGSFGNASSVLTITTNGKGLITAISSQQANLAASQITSGTFADALIALSNVTQYQGSLALSATQITSGTFSDARIAQSNVTQHQGALTIGETQITDGTLLARNAGNETITGTWTFNNAITGSLTGAASLNVLKAGDTMTGSLAINGSGNNLHLSRFSDGAAAVFTVGGRVGTGLSLYNGGGVTAEIVVDSGALSFATSTTERMRIDANGNVGIGATPASASRATLQIGAYGAIDNNGGSGIEISSNAVYNSGWKYINTAVASQYYTTAGMHAWQRAVSGTAGTALTWVESMRIDGSGNVGIGVIPSAWAGGFKPLQLSSSSIAGYDSGAGNIQTEIDTNAYQSSLGSYNYINSYAALQYRQVLGTGHLWSTAAAGTAGGAITWVEQLRIDTTGRLGIGGTPGAWIHIKQAGTATVASGAMHIIAQDTGANNSRMGMVATQTQSAFITGGSSTNPPFTWLTNDGSAEQMRLTSANVLMVNTTVVNTLMSANSKLTVQGSTGRSTFGDYAWSGTAAIDTGISINQTNAGGAMLLLASRNTSAGLGTDAAVYLVRFFYDGNNAPTTVYIGGSSNFLTFGVSGSNTLTATNAGGGNTTISWFANK